MNKADSSLGFFRKIQSDKVCVFISHKKEDQDIAIELGKYLTEQLDVDIYLDLFDSELREAVSVENDAKIVASVINGLKLSQVLLCIITDKTRLSWWVPYEIGMADNAGVKIPYTATQTNPAADRKYPSAACPAPRFPAFLPHPQNPPL